MDLTLYHETTHPTIQVRCRQATGLLPSPILYNRVAYPTLYFFHVSYISSYLPITFHYGLVLPHTMFDHTISPNPIVLFTLFCSDLHYHCSSTHYLMVCWASTHHSSWSLLVKLVECWRVGAIIPSTLKLYILNHLNKIRKGISPTYIISLVGRK